MKLKAKIIEKGMSVKEVAEKMDLDISTLRRKIRDLNYFRRGEMLQIAKILGLTKREMFDIFFG